MTATVSDGSSGVAGGRRDSGSAAWFGLGSAASSGAATLGASQLLGHSLAGSVPLAMGVGVTALLLVGQNHDAHASRVRKASRELRRLDAAGLASYVTDLAERDGVTIQGREVLENGSTDLSARLADGTAVMLRVAGPGWSDVEHEILAFVSAAREGHPLLVWVTSERVPAGSVRARGRGVVVLDRDRLASWRLGAVPLPLTRAGRFAAGG